jgi:hypothetical protein
MGPRITGAHPRDIKGLDRKLRSFARRRHELP